MLFQVFRSIAALHAGYEWCVQEGLLGDAVRRKMQYHLYDHSQSQPHVQYSAHFIVSDSFLFFVLQLRMQISNIEILCLPLISRLINSCSS